MKTDRPKSVKTESMLAGSLMHSVSGVAGISSDHLYSGARYDLVVYSSTPNGIMTALSASRLGLHVALMHKVPDVGGMMASSLSFTDKGKSATLGGIAGEFFERVSRHYSLPEVWGFEPHVAEAVYGEMLKEAKVTVNLNVRLKEFNRVAEIGNSCDRVGKH